MTTVLKQLNEDKSELEMTPMIDVTFLLLIFFMCTIKFKTLEGKLAAYLPKDVGVNTSEAEPKEKVEVKLKVLKEGSKRDPNDIDEPWAGQGAFQYGPDRVIQYSIGPMKTQSLNTVAKRLEDYYETDPERGMTIDPLPPAVNADVMRVLDRALQAGFTDITFLGAPTPKEK